MIAIALFYQIIIFTLFLRQSICTSENDIMNELQGINIYVIGNSVMRHYSFSLLSYLDGLPQDISLNRTEEKSTCNGVLGMSSCDHYSVKSKSFIRFLWKQYIGNGTCDDLKRDFCYGIDDDHSERCIKLAMPQLLDEAKGAYVTSSLGKSGGKLTSSRDILLIASIPMNTELWCANGFQQPNEITTQYKHILHGHRFLFKDGSEFVSGANPSAAKLFSQDVVDWTGRMLLRAFPGRILYVSFPLINVHNIRFPEEHINEMIVRVNDIIKEGISQIDEPRIRYVDVTSILASHIDEYVDHIHHPGRLSELIIQQFVKELNPLTPNHLSSPNTNTISTSSCKFDEYINGSWIETNSTSNTRQSFSCCDENSRELSCGVTLGHHNSWSHSLIQGKLLRFSPDQACLCDQEDNRLNKTNRRQNFHWTPNNCHVTPWNSTNFCTLLGKNKILLVGDSLMHQEASTLYNMVIDNDNKSNNNTESLACADNIYYGLSSHLIYGLEAKLQKGHNVMAYMNEVGISAGDIVLLNSAAHVGDSGDMYTIWEVLKRSMETEKIFKGVRMGWITQSPGHPSCDMSTEPLKAYVTPTHYDYTTKYNWHSFPSYDTMSEEYCKMLNFSVLNLAPVLRLRPDGHKAARGSKYDCFHWCMPGPLDLFPSILHHKMLNGEI